MFQVTRQELLLPSHESFSALRNEFGERQSLHLPGFVGSSLLDHLTTGLQTARFNQTVHLDSRNREFARDQTIDGRNVVTHIFHLMLNNADLFKAVQSLTGCQNIGSFAGRVYRSASGGDHHLEWHDDREDPSRLIGLTINFSNGPYSGGLFQIRYKNSGIVLNEVANTEAGGAILFRISADLEHRITPVEGNNAKVAGAGWFLSTPNSLATIRNMATRSNRQ